MIVGNRSRIRQFSQSSVLGEIANDLDLRARNYLALLDS
jgi:hypothetical protein